MQLGDEDKAIADCGTAIKLDPDNAEAYYRRGDAYSFQKEYDKAIADFGVAIRLQPKFIGPWFDRANAFYFKGEVDRAIEGYTGLLAFAPKFHAAYAARGAVHLYKGALDLALADYDSALAQSSRDEYLWFRAFVRRLKGEPARAIADFNRLAEQSPADARWALWLEIAGREAGVRSRLAEAVARLDMTVWPAPVVRLFLGQLTPDAVLAAAEDKDAELKQYQMCEARTFIGELDLIEGRKNAAFDGFRVVAKECSYASFEVTVAQGELRRAGVAP
jgi:tetratricopeptide (TPR) repeat protein